MNRSLTLLLTFLLALSITAGILFSKISFIGRVGINLFYKNYSFFKVWWQGAGLVFAIFFIWMGLHYLLRRYATAMNALISYILTLLLAIAGLVFTYNDFRHDFSHRLTGERFHLGGYCFWLGFISISLYYIVNRKKTPTV
ncbi:MAG: cytochrome d ubiquinol oxidase subunit II [Sphingobacteriales bacterium]|nr:MAG: cytochrome d ubiquinol oxidase subunit II [Sphingobacteriales bacterium]